MTPEKPFSIGYDLKQDTHTTPFEFRVGDIIKIYGTITGMGVSGSYVRLGEGLQSYSVLIPNEHIQLVERPKKKIKKTIEFWVNFYEDMSFESYGSLSIAVNAVKTSSRKLVTCQSFAREIEVDDE